MADAVREDMARHRLAPDSCVTVYKGHDLAWYSDPPADLQAIFGIPSGAFIVGTVANYRPRKGLEILIEAARGLPGNAPIHFLLVGRGTDHPRLRKRLAASPFRDRFHFPGFRKDACSLMAACDCSVLPSTKREGLPKTVIELRALVSNL